MTSSTLAPRPSGDPRPSSEARSGHLVSPWALVLLPIGPLFVGVLRFVLPYYTADDNTAAAQAVLRNSGRESLVLWLGMAAILTLIPGIYAARELLPATRLRAVAVTLLVVGYLSLPAVLAEDHVLWAGAKGHLDAGVIGSLVSDMHPSYGIGLGIFVVGHVLGTVLLGVAVLRSRQVSAPIAWMLIISQPLHFLTTVVLGIPWLELVAWGMTAFGMAALAMNARTTSARSR